MLIRRGWDLSRSRASITRAPGSGVLLGRSQKSIYAARTPLAAKEVRGEGGGLRRGFCESEQW